jgi:GntR family transcriptional regulator
VSRFTVAKALEILSQEGALTRRQGLGTFVAAPPLKRAPSYLLSFSEAVAAAGHRPSQRLLGFGPTSWRDDLPYPADEPLILFDRLRLVDRAPAAITRSVIPVRVAERIGLTRTVAAREDVSLYRMFEAAGLPAARGSESLRARAASRDEAELLGLPSGAAAVVMSVRRVTIDAENRVLDVGDSAYDARRYAYEVDMRRSPAAVSLDPTKGENDNAQNNLDRRDIGARLGPWGELPDRRG